MVRILLYGLLIYLIAKMFFGNTSKRKENFEPKRNMNNTPKKEKKVKSDVGEYVDFEEVKD